MNQYLQAKKGEFQNAIEFFKKDITSLRTGRASTAMLDGIQVEAYGIKNALVSVGSISVADGRSLVITPWDRNVLKEVEKAIVEADLGVGVVNEGDKIRVTVPPMTEENRKDLIKKLNEKTEQAKISVRQVREAVKGSIDKAEKDKEITEDEKFSFTEEMETEVKKANEELKVLRDKKETEIMTI